MKRALVWMRRDLRIQDHTALIEASRSCDEVLLAFIFDKNIIDQLPKDDKRLTFIIESINEIQAELSEKYDSKILIRYGDPINEIPSLIKKYKVTELHYNRDYESYAISRDKKIEKVCSQVSVHSHRDHVTFEPHEVMKGDGTPYKVYTPYKNAWLDRFYTQLERVKVQKANFSKLAKVDEKEKSLYQLIGKEKQELIIIPGRSGALAKLKEFKKNISHYHETRDLLTSTATSGLSPYLRHGVLSIREVLSISLHGNSVLHQTFLNELVWREFYQMILNNFSHVEKRPFKENYEVIKWDKDKKLLDAWKNGQTGYPIVDAAMRCLNETGLMPNRLRMVTASFLCKNLFLDWREGEKYFALKLLDFDLGANNGGWQWSSSTGCDSQPYFRIFNPYAQSSKFDPNGDFIKKWCPELKELNKKEVHAPQDVAPLTLIEKGITLGTDYPYPIIDYKKSREQTLEKFKKALK